MTSRITSTRTNQPQSLLGDTVLLIHGICLNSKEYGLTLTVNLYSYEQRKDITEVTDQWTEPSITLEYLVTNLEYSCRIHSSRLLESPFVEPLLKTFECEDYGGGPGILVARSFRRDVSQFSSE